MEPVHLGNPDRGIRTVGWDCLVAGATGRTRLGKENNMESQYLMWFLIAFIFIVVIL